MSIFKIFKKTTPTIEEQLEGWTDAETLRNFLRFMPRVGIGTEFVQDQHGFITHQTLHIQCGDEVFTSYARELDWPLEPVAFPEEHRKGLN